LEGKTAREAVRSDEGRRAAIELIRIMQNDEERSAAAPGTAFDCNILRRDLGLVED